MNVDKLIEELEERRRLKVKESISYTRIGSSIVAACMAEAADSFEEAIAIVKRHAKESHD